MTRGLWGFCMFSPARGAFAARAKCKNFQGLVFTLNRDKLLTALGFKIERKNTIQCLGDLRMEDQ